MVAPTPDLVLRHLSDLSGSLLVDFCDRGGGTVGHVECALENNTYSGAWACCAYGVCVYTCLLVSD